MCAPAKNWLNRSGKAKTVMNENYLKNRAMYTLPAYVICCCMILCFDSSALLAEEIDHHGKKVYVHDGAACLQCHEDMKDHSHPNITPYPPLNMENEKKYPPVEELAKAGLTIQNGRITCITCHDISNPEPYHPVRGMEGKSKLCLVCHNK